MAENVQQNKCMDVKVKFLSGPEMARAKQAQRDEDKRLIAKGAASPKSVQAKNSAFAKLPPIVSRPFQS